MSKYPLSELLTIKVKRFEKAVKIFEEKTKKLLKEREKLFSLEKERDEVLNHKKKETGSTKRSFGHRRENRKDKTDESLFKRSSRKTKGKTKKGKRPTKSCRCC
jgi:hypothetical protein